MNKSIILVWAALAFWIGAAEHNSIPRPLPSGSTGFGSDAAQLRAEADLPPFQSPEAMHAEFHSRFIASPGFGFSRIIRPIFRVPAPALVHDRTKYRVVAPELIGLEDEPSVYGVRQHAFTNPKETNSSSRELFQT